jgi:hypothetical protein
LKNSRSMTNYCQYLAAGLTLLKQLTPLPRRHVFGTVLRFYEGPYV